MSDTVSVTSYKAQENMCTVHSNHERERTRMNSKVNVAKCEQLVNLGAGFRNF